jgi:Tfp pilus assembly protein PilN
MLVATGIMVGAALVASGVHVAVFLRSARSVEDLKDEIARIEAQRTRTVGELDTSRARISAPSAQKLIRELIAIEGSGITRSVPPAEVLSELTRVMPDDAKTLSVELETSLPEQRLQLEVLSDSTEAAEQLLEGLSQSPMVVEAEILDERHGADGGIYLRVGAELTLPGDMQ